MVLHTRTDANANAVVVGLVDARAERRLSLPRHVEQQADQRLEQSAGCL